ncbi:hypothetical protein GCM10025867_44760 [Frondihabitans sucicola]|uniref:Glycosyl hydrolase family protein n=1 Tax=Frondihabitans sucicola TaxID=1268041 RepID=A0ABM8GUT5_9MICO|nr:family 1 glycosylhydrolase [Frondihabitans sucicola]BDZ52235.1 hypothetical protein GCM10025867_44760 [Frondihabitans sucicola]
MSAAFERGTLTWVAGIEDTCVYPPARFAMEALDEYDLTEHSLHWRSDLDTVQELGVTALRYGVNWPRVHTAPHEFDWAVLDERLAYATEDLGLTVIADLVHYGTPTWLDDSFADPRYPDAVAEFAGAFAERYRGLVDHITPLNEPVTTASFCGLRGVWPPALTGWDGWATVVLGIVEGMARSIEAIRAANPEAVVVHVEASALYAAGAPHLGDLATHLESIGTLPTDLLLGRVTPEHELYDWLVSQGATAERLDRLTRDPARIDLMGVNYYPDLSPRTLVDAEGQVSQVATNRWAEGLAATLRTFAERYRLPLVVTETSIEGDDDVRAAWVDASIDAVRALVAEGVDVRGYTWWPVFDFVDWSFASGGRNVEEFQVDDGLVEARSSSTASKSPYLRRMGLIRLDEQEDGTLARVPTAAADGFAARTRAAGADVIDDLSA